MEDRFVSKLKFNTMKLDLSVTIGLFLGLGTFMWSVYKYFDKKKREQNFKEFETYHNLIKELVQPDSGSNLYLDRQATIIYELRHFKRSYSFSYRTLLGLKETWGESHKAKRLIEEIDLTLKYLKAKLKDDELKR